jgi:MFS family permease
MTRGAFESEAVDGLRVDTPTKRKGPDTPITPTDSPYFGDSGNIPPNDDGTALLVLNGSMDAEPAALKTTRPWSMPQLMALFAVMFSYAFVFNTVSNIVIPQEIERLATSRQSIWVGLIMAAGALSQIATPVVGAWSDRSGVRTSYLFYGTVGTVVGIVIFLAAGTLNDMLMLFAAHVTTSIGLSVQYSMAQALLNDYVQDDQIGKGSGVMAVLAIIGSGLGYGMFALNVPLAYGYMAYIVASVVCLGICVVTIPPPNDAQQAALLVKKRLAADTTWSQHVALALSVPSPRKHADFFFACLGRALFNTGLGGQVYLVYYFRDVLRAPNPTQMASLVAVMALFGGLVGAVPAGILSDRIGKKPVIYGAIACCIASLSLFMVVREPMAVQLVGFLYGFGNVAYLSVDYALGVQSLPRHINGRGVRGAPINAAKDLGVFAMSATIGQLFGQVIYGALLEQFSVVTPTKLTKYSHGGVVARLTPRSIVLQLSALSTSLIKSVK